MTRHFRTMTVEALSYRADRTDDMGCVADWIGGEDYRSVRVFYVVDGSYGTSDGVFYRDDASAEVIGVVLGGDDPSFHPTVLDREGARDLFGDAWVTTREEFETERLV